MILIDFTLGIIPLMENPISASTQLSNRYQLEDKLGFGGMAVVYRARDLMLERTVAVKILRRDFSNDPDFRERFRQEAKAAANLSHPNIVTVHDFGLDHDQLFIVMEFVPGSDLKSMLKTGGRFQVEEALNLILQACAGIGYAHRAGVIHCDIKPQNMLITPDMRLKVVDFGIARALASIAPDEQSDVVWGSPYYFSPEQAAGNAPCPASDVYCLGVVLYEMLTGYLPFRADSAEELARLHREALPPSLRRYNPAIPVSLEQIILKALSKDPNQRFPDADQLGTALRATLKAHNEFLTEIVPLPNTPLASQQYPAQNHNGMVLPDDFAYATPDDLQHITEIEKENQRPKKNRLTLDWITWILALLALIAAGGLIPFWLWVYYMLYPPV